ncbi:MAG: DNA recombination protein RmuC [Hyphomicrobiales bacterium]
MDFSQPVTTIGDTVVTLGDAAVIVVTSVVLLLVVIAGLLIVSYRSQRSDTEDAARKTADLEMRLAEMTGRLTTVSESAAGRDAHLARTLDQRLDQISVRMGQNAHEQTKRTSESLRQVYERLAVIDSAQKNITELSTQVVGLQDILSNKQSRGAFGQGRMEAIVADGLPRSAYSFQHTLSNGTRPDCVINLPNTDTVVVIDAKFPLEAFNALRDAKHDAAATTAAQQLRGDVTRHIKDISGKYLIPGETQDTAIMFVPSESIYADLHETFEDLVQKAYRARVVIVSPNMLMLAIQTMQAIFKDAQMREQAGVIKVQVAHMMQDVQRLRDRVLNLQKHFGQVGQDIEQILISSDKLSKRGLKIEQLEFEAETIDTEEAIAPAAKLAAGE